MSTSAMTGRDPADCPFCHIIAGDLDPGVCLPISSAFALLPALHQRPGHRGHTLLAPANHVSTLEDLPAGLAEPMIGGLKLATTAVKHAFAASGVSVRLNLGLPGQSVAHLHFHIIPRYLDDEFFSEGPMLVPLEDRLAQTAAIAQVLKRMSAGEISWGN